MGTYEAGNKTKHKISECARGLFYQHGFNNTTYKQLGTVANVNLGMIVYHFKSLDNLADVVYQEILEERAKEFFRQADKLFGETLFKRSTLLLAFTRANVQSYLDYPNYAGFVAERLIKSLTLDASAFDSTLNEVCKDYNLEIPKEEAQLQKYQFLPFPAIAVNAVHLGAVQDISAKEICDYTTKIRLRSYGLSEPQIDEIIKDVDFIASKIRLDIDDHMHFISEDSNTEE